MNTQTKYYEMQEDKEYSDEIVTEVIDLFKEIYRSKGRERFIQCYHLLKLGHR